MSDDLVYSIKDIFDVNSPEGVLRRKEAKKYYIAPYQRGFKWAAVSSDDAVCVLMQDLFDAAKNQNNEYYLQFITTKSSKAKGIPVLEVIDGQQRLTTLTILLSVLSYKKGNDEDAISNGLLLYEVREKVNVFFQNHIYQKIDTLMSDSWDEFILKFPDNDEQDIYYLFNAAKKINEMLAAQFNNDKDAIIIFEEYLLEQVKIILNHIDRNIVCEEIFSNLNDNKVELTSSELIKGLILTNSARELPNTGRTITYKEITELRAIMGRQWDEIAHWANRDEIKTFFFPNSNNVFDDLLLLLACDNGFEKTIDISSKNNIVFNFFQSQIKDQKKTAKELFDNLKEIKYVLNEWFNDDNIYNSLGYVFFCRRIKKTIRDYLSFIRRDKSDLKNELNNNISNILSFNIDDLQYRNNNPNWEIHDLLLAMSVFGNKDKNKNRFNFMEFNSRTWSLEHIFPQTPDELKDELRQKDIVLLNSLCGDNLGNFEKVKSKLQEYEDSMDIESVYNSISEKLKGQNCIISSDEKTILYKLITIDKLNHIGNMALLTGPDNSSNSNGMFDDKRHNIVKLISGGSFVPKHTYDVFSKLISKKMTPDLTVWTTTDIDAHSEWIKNKINIIRGTK
jgi:hypothetical protein